MSSSSSSSDNSRRKNKYEKKKLPKTKRGKKPKHTMIKGRPPTPLHPICMLATSIYAVIAALTSFCCCCCGCCCFFWMVIAFSAGAYDTGSVNLVFGLICTVILLACCIPALIMIIATCILYAKKKRNVQMYYEAFPEEKIGRVQPAMQMQMQPALVTAPAMVAMPPMNMGMNMGMNTGMNMGMNMGMNTGMNMGMNTGNSGMMNMNGQMMGANMPGMVAPPMQTSPMQPQVDPNQPMIPDNSVYPAPPQSNVMYPGHPPV